jgi:hypothetical protein
MSTAECTGIVIRQKLDPASPVLTQSPDLIVTDAGETLTSLLRNMEAYLTWYFSQAPVPGSANSLYVRGISSGNVGAQRARVYLYWVSAEDLLNPAKWDSSGFTVDGTAQNHVQLSTVSLNQIVTAAMGWTPPAGIGTRYFLISWTDNSVDPHPPQWPSEPFADRAAFDAYVAQHDCSMAVLDTVYRGAFLRQFPGQTVFQGGTGARTSPDLIVSGAAAARDAAHFATPGSYNPGKISGTAASGVRNFVYIRALHTTDGPARARVYVYWARTSNVSPTSWNRTNFTFAGRPQNWVDLHAAAGNDVMVSTVPLVWSAPLSGDVLLAAYADSSPNPQPPNFTPFGFLDPDTVAKFVASSPRLSWLTITGQQVPTPTMTSQTPLTAGTGNNSLYVGARFTDVPVGGTLSLSVPGPDAASTIVVDSMRVPDPEALVAWPVTYPDDFQTSAVISYYEDSTPGDGSIVATMVPRPAGPR